MRSPSIACEKKIRTKTSVYWGNQQRKHFLGQHAQFDLWVVNNIWNNSWWVCALDTTTDYMLLESRVDAARIEILNAQQRALRDVAVERIKDLEIPIPVYRGVLFR